MVISFSAFHNCKNLQQINFEKCIDVVQTNIRPEDNCKEASIIVPSKLKAQYEECNPRLNIKTYVEFLQHNLKSIKNIASIQSIIFLRKARNLLRSCKVIDIIDYAIYVIRQYSSITDKQIDDIKIKLQEIENKKRQQNEQ